jgi:hypothetical protein
MDNPYLEESRQYIFSNLFANGEFPDHHKLADCYLARERFVKEYAWAIPNELALETIAKYSPIIEIGAGSGYWARLLSDMGVDIVAYDISPFSNPIDGNAYTFTKEWFDVKKGDGREKLIAGSRTLFMCWPPLHGGDDTLSLYTGQTLIYVGEGEGGCTGNDRFQEMIDNDFDLVDVVNIPQWDGIHDRLRVYNRK